MVSSGGNNYADWAQVVVATLAILAASFPIQKFITGRFLTMRAECFPVGAGLNKKSKTWDIELSNRSRFFGGFSVSLFPAGSRNTVAGFQQLTPNDGGMVIAPDLVEGALEIKVTRFHKRRVLKIRVQFARPDHPMFDAGSVRMVRKITSRAGEKAEIVLALVYQRLMLFMLVFFGVTMMIAVALLRGGWTYR